MKVHCNLNDNEYLPFWQGIPMVKMHLAYSQKIAKIGKEFPYIQKVRNLVRKSLINFQSENLTSFKKLQNWLNSNPYFSAETSLFCQLAKLWWLLFNGTSWKVCKKLDFSRKLLHFWNFLSGVFAGTAFFFVILWKTGKLCLGGTATVLEGIKCYFGVQI